MRTPLLAGILALTACSPPPAPPSAGPPPDVFGPYTGPTTRFFVDRLVLPIDHTQLADVLVPGGRPSNHFGDVVSALVSSSDQATPQVIADQIAAGVVDLQVELQSDDPALLDDESVGVTLVDAGALSEPLGGALVSGTLLSNRTRDTRHPVSVSITLPVMGDADPFTVTLVGAEIDLYPDRAGGFDSLVHGAVVDPLNVLPPLVYRGLLQGLSLHPELHPYYFQLFDDNHDGVISEAEVAANMLINNILSPDVQLFQDGAWAPTAGTARDSFSVGVWMHLAPCRGGRCAGPIADHCDDRVADGGETDVDCGGACSPCGAGAKCGAPGDCQSKMCTLGACAPT